MKIRLIGLCAALSVSACSADSGSEGSAESESAESAAPEKAINELTLENEHQVRFDLESPVPFQVVDSEPASEGPLQQARAALITGADDRLRSDAANYPYRAQAALRRTTMAINAYCTGFKITPRHILTAAHCMYWQGTWQTLTSTLRVVYFQNGDNTGTKYASSAIYVPQQWINSTPNAQATAPDWNFDYALITLPEPNNTNGWFDFQAETNTPSNLVATFSGYPGSTAQCKDPSNSICGGYQYRSTGTFDAIYSNLFVTRADWESGQSGGPLYYLPQGQTQYKAIGIISNERIPAAGQPFVVGTHGNRGLRITTAVQNDLCNKINVDRPSTLPTHFCYH